MIRRWWVKVLTRVMVKCAWRLGYHWMQTVDTELSQSGVLIFALSAETFVAACEQTKSQPVGILMFPNRREVMH